MPARILGIGIGGTAEKAALMAKEAAMESIDMAELKARGPQNKLEELRIELYDKINALGIGAQGVGGMTTVLDVKINMYPTHAASKPVAIIPNCAATRHAHFVLDGSGRFTSTRHLCQTGRRSTGIRMWKIDPRQSEYADERRSRVMETGTDPAVER